MGITYKDAGVDIEAGDEAVQRIKAHVRSTFSKDVLADAGHFGGVVSAEKLKKYKHPVLITSIDSVGTKLMVTRMAGKWDTAGLDMVGHSVNDILAVGAEPMFFTDYIASSKVEPGQIEEIVKGLAQGCRENSMSLIAGEIAELPGVYHEGEIDLVGSIVGIAEKEKMLDGAGTKEGDVLVGLPSDGLHTNGFSLARKVLFEVAGFGVDDKPEELGGVSVGETLLKPHKSYLKAVLPFVKEGMLKGIAHITGGGLVDNVPRVIPKGLGAKIERSKIKTQAIFKLIQEKGDVPEADMWRTFNMGIGMVLIASPENAKGMLQKIQDACEIGKVVKGSGVELV